MSRPGTHARHDVGSGPPYSLDSALHVSRYTWAIDHLVRPGDTAVDLGCGTGFGLKLLASTCDHVVGVDLDPEVTTRAANLDATNISLYCDDACSPGLAERIGCRAADVVLSMETIEHLEDYFSYIENAIRIMAPAGTFVVGTPNRTMTYERYSDRRHMDPSHVQEFTPTSLVHTLRSYFESVDLLFQFVPGFWDAEPAPPTAAPAGGWPTRVLKGWTPPYVTRLGRAARSRARRPSPAAVPRTDVCALNEIAFRPVSEAPELARDAFALVAVCKRPRP